MTHQGHVSTTRQLLDKPQRELLTVIFYGYISSVEADAAVQKLPPVTSRKFGPSHIRIPKRQLLARPEIRHPRVNTATS
jgi:hypothetical protein